MAALGSRAVRHGALRDIRAVQGHLPQVRIYGRESYQAGVSFVFGLHVCVNMYYDVLGGVASVKTSL